MDKITTRDRERFVLGATLSLMWGRDTWQVVEERERPDFVVRSPSGPLLGVEVTEILTAEQGEQRALDGRLNQTAVHVIRQWLDGGGHDGCFVVGHNFDVPARDEDLSSFRAALAQHLASHGDNRVPSLRTPFTHSWGAIRAIARWPRPEVYLSGDGWGQPLPYAAGRPHEAIESHLIDAIGRKCSQASSYDRTNPLWLILRNPNQGVSQVTSDTLEIARRLGKGIFERIFLLNEPLGTRDARPPFSRIIDLL